MIRNYEILGALIVLLVLAVWMIDIKSVQALSLAQRLNGQILLQVEEHGEAWYVYPNSLQRYFLGRPADAFSLMRNLGLGITNNDLKKIPVSTGPGSTNHSFAQKLSGQILLQVEEHGEAWYVYPLDLKRYYLGRPADAFSLMRNLGLGISNKDILNISVAQDSKNGNGYQSNSGTVAEIKITEDSEINELLATINIQRMNSGVEPLRLINELRQAAQAQINDMVSKNYTSFTSPDGKEIKDWVKEAGYGARVLAQNLLQTNQDVKGIVSTWKNEGGASFTNVIDGQYRDVGIGIGKYNGLSFYTVVFALSLNDYFLDATTDLKDIGQVREEMLVRVNQERLKQGLPALVRNAFLEQAAQAHTDDMLNRSYYGHETPEGIKPHERILASGYLAQATAENIAKGQFSVQEVMDGWMNSPGHRANILAVNLSEVGFGLSFGLNQNGYEILWAQNFGAPRY